MEYLDEFYISNYEISIYKHCNGLLYALKLRPGTLTKNNDFLPWLDCPQGEIICTNYPQFLCDILDKSISKTEKKKESFYNSVTFCVYTKKEFDRKINGYTPGVLYPRTVIYK